MSEKRGHWYLLTGLLIGLAIGIVYAWLIAPVEYTDTSPASLRADFKDEYRYLIAASHRVHGNIDRTRARLFLLNDPDPVAALGEQAQRLLAADAPNSAVRALADLAEILQNPTSPVDENTPAQEVGLVSPTSAASAATLGRTLTSLPTDATSPFEPILDPSETPLPEPSATETPTLKPGLRTATATRTPQRSPTPIATATLKPSLTPTATPGSPFQLVKQATFCDPDLPALLQVFLENAMGDPASGVEITITWLGGQEEFFSGLKPELGHGYADFVMTPGVEYVLSLDDGVIRISGLQSASCSGDAGDYPGGVRLEFRQP